MNKRQQVLPFMRGRYKTKYTNDYTMEIVIKLQRTAVRLYSWGAEFGAPTLVGCLCRDLQNELKLSRSIALLEPPQQITTTEIYSFMVQEPRSPKSRCWQECAPCEVSEGDDLLASSSFSWLLEFWGLWLHHLNLCPCLHRDLFGFLCVYVSQTSLCFLIKTSVLEFRAHPKSRKMSPGDPWLNYTHKGLIAK